MILNLDDLPYLLAIKIIKWCFEHDIDRNKCIKLLDILSVGNREGSDEVSWEIEIPDKYLSFLTLKFHEFQLR
jgi:hypothetical protein